MELCICYAYVAIAVGVMIYLFDRWYRRPFIPDFNGKYVFITGTDSGFGHKLAVDLDRRGLHIYAGCYTKKGAENLKSKTSSNLKTIPLDITDQASVENAKSFIENDLPSGKDLWGVVNNAGIMGLPCFDLATEEDYLQVMEVNFFGSIRVIRVFEKLIKQSKGRIVQVISVAGRGCLGCAPYTSSKHALEPYTDELRRNFKQSGVKVCSIEPTIFANTDIVSLFQWNEIMKQRFEELSDWKKDSLGKNFAENEFKKWKQFVNNLLFKLNSNLDVVTEAITHGLGAKHPKSRYLVGHGSRIFVLLAGYTPDWFLDYFILKYMP